ncbi:tyrosyl-DNA phosphodiesterase 1 isoform X2 [Magnolia sinica]|uniref:tyrosyl-DNA phosphodiesterase 1 isoform X2 n=1 Tax=Magnolia sinica TaxID=86752 RepID=UPI0026581690|nr:tyrosyl-DNA phosphodiesterase 1 isoform X2 [Magnolia sinica]
MAESRVKVGFLAPIKNNKKEADNASGVPIFEGVNVIGRNDLSVSDKRVSRKHISLTARPDGSAEVVVEGPNPIIVKSGDQRKKICSQDKVMIVHGDILELIPGNFYFKFIALAIENHTSSSKTNASFSTEGKKLSEVETVTLKRKRQVLEDEAFARTLQDELGNGSNSLVTVKQVDTLSRSGTIVGSHDNLEAIRRFRVDKNELPLTFRLMRVQGLPAWANSSSVSIGDVIQGNVLVAVLSNYMVDMDWLISACPILRKIPHGLVIHGESGARVEHMKKSMPANWVLHRPPLPISYGTHHSKAMLLVYLRGVRIVVHTANLIYVDWNNKSQGLWMQDFPWKDQKNLSRPCAFENDLVDYLNALKLPDVSVNLPGLGNVNVNASFFKKFDYSNASVRLIASVPGYHAGSNLKKWGHMKLRTILQECVFDKEFRGSPLVYQFSSLGSLDEKWMAELASSMSSGLSDDKTPLGLGKAMIIWPTVEDVRCSLEGYAAGNAIPSPQKNIEKDFLKKYWARWKADHTGRGRAMPHIKTFTRYNGQNLAWFLLTSANLSKAAWGALQKNNSQLMIRSYEGNKCESSRNAEGCKTKPVTLCGQGKRSPDSSSAVIQLPVPYELPPQPYKHEDIPWSWDRRYQKKDVYGQVWPLHVQLYTDQDS